MSSTASGVKLRFAATQFQVISGIRRASSDCASSVTGGGGVARKGSLYILTEPRADLALGVDACQVVQQTIAREFYADPSPSATTSLSHALVRANLALLEHNRHASPAQRALVGVSCAVLHPDEVYIAQLPPAQLYLAHQGTVRAFPRPKQWPFTSPAPYPPATLGSGTADPDPDIARSPVEIGDAVILCSSNLAALFSEVDAQEHFVAADPYQIIDYLYDLTQQARIGEAYAVALVAEADSGGKPTRARTTAEYRTTTTPTETANGNRRFALPFTLPSLPKRQPQERGPEQDYQPSPIPLRGPGPQVTIDRSEGEAWEDSPPQPNQPVTAPPRNPRIDNLLSLRDRLTQRGSNAPAAPSVEDEEAEIGFTPPAPGTPVANIKANDYASPQPPAASPLAATAVPSLDDADEQFTSEYLSNEEAAESVEDKAIATRRFDISPLADGVRNLFSKVATAASGASRRVANRGAAATSEYPAEERVDYAAQAAARRSSSTAFVSPAEAADYEDEETVPRPSRRVPIWAVAVALVVIIAILAFSITQGMASQKSQQLHDLLNQAGANMASAQSGADKTTQRSYLAQAKQQLDAAAKVNPNDPDLHTARSRWQTISDNVNLITRLPQPQLLFELPTATGVTTNAGSYLSQVIVQGGDAYLLDRGAGVLYRYKIGASEPAKTVLAPGDANVKGKLLYITWRVDTLVALDDQYNAYLYNPASDQVTVTALGGTSSFTRPLDIASFDGNIYILGAKANQIEKYSTGRYDSPPIDWLASSATGMVSGGSKLTIDGNVYVLTNNSRVLRFSGGQLAAQFDPNAGNDAVQPAASAPHDILTSPDNQYIYTIEATGGAPDDQGGRILQFGKDGKLLHQYMAEAGSSVIADLRSAFVSPDDRTLYLITENRLYQASLPNAPANSATPLPGLTPTPLP